MRHLVAKPTLVNLKRTGCGNKVNAKNLHKHSLPVLGLLAVVFVLSISLANRVTLPATSNVLGRALVTRFLKVEPTSKGIARLQINHQLASANVATPDNSTVQSELQTVGDSSGKLVRLNFVVEVLNTTQLDASK
jgi:hypothetical protein